ncbi:hypothetical protein NSTCB13_00450 [Nostoc sp. DSM 114160]
MWFFAELTTRRLKLGLALNETEMLIERQLLIVFRLKGKDLEFLYPLPRLLQEV